MPLGHEKVSLFSISGMDYDSKPYTLESRSWRVVFNFRKNGGLKQVPRKKVALTVSGASTFKQLIGLPTSSHATWIGVTRSNVYQLRDTTSQVLATLSGTDETFDSCVYNGRVFFTSPSNPAQYTDGSQVKDLFSHRKSWTKPCGWVMQGDGPFTDLHFYSGNEVDGEYDLDVDLGATFTWTSGSYYRVYVEWPLRFKVGWGITISQIEIGAAGSGMTGTITGVEKDWIEVLATNTVASVPNTKEDQRAMVSTTSAAMPSGEYIKVFYDHVVIGAPLYKGKHSPWACQWSDLQDFAEWDPDSHNEADSRTFSGFESKTSLVEGVTGMQLLGSILMVFTADSIFALEYTGHPRIVRASAIDSLKGYGCGLKHSSLQYGDSVAWIDLGKQDFVVYRGQGPESIGNGIRDWFFHDINQDPDLAQKTWAYVDKGNDELVWVYIPVGETTFKRAVAYNYKYKEWTARSVENINCAGLLYRRLKGVDELVGTCASLTGTCQDLGKTSVAEGSVWGSEGGTILVEAGPSEPESGLLAQETPYLETGDFLFGSIQHVKETDEIALSSTKDIVVEVSTRTHIDSPVTWMNVGTWEDDLSTYDLTFAGKDGRVMRFKFTPSTPSNGCEFSGFETNVLSVGAER